MIKLSFYDKDNKLIRKYETSCSNYKELETVVNMDRCGWATARVTRRVRGEEEKLYTFTNKNLDKK